MKKLLKFLFITGIFLATLIRIDGVLAAGTCNVNITGPDSIVQGKSGEYTVVITNITGSGVTSYSGLYDNGANSTITNVTKLLGDINTGTKKFVWASMGTDTLVSNTSIFRITLRGDSIGATVLSLGDVKINDDSGRMTCNAHNKNINVVSPPSSKANLKSLSVSPGAISFSSSNTNYNLSVDPNTTTINIAAATEDARATVSGLGSKSLQYGDNSFNVVVTAEDKSTKTYKIVVKREDNRSGDASLRSLSPNVSSLSPSFSSNKTMYEMNIPHDVTSVSFKALSTDSKAIIGNTTFSNLAAGKVMSAKIVVTAENGTTKTYTVNIRRASDPNKEQSSDNNLVGLVVTLGEMKQTFNKDVLSYDVIVEASTTRVEIKPDLSDKEYGSFIIEGDEELSQGLNVYKVVVTAEDGTKKTYTINVRKDAGPSTLLLDFGLKGATLVSTFDPQTKVYYYQGNIEDIKPVAEDVNADVTIEKEDGVYIVTVKSSDSSIGTYVLIPAQQNKNSFIKPFLLGFGIPIGIGLIGFLILKLKKRTKLG